MMVKSLDDEFFSQYQEGILWGHQLKYLWQQENYKHFLIESIDYQVDEVKTCLTRVGYNNFLDEMLEECDSALGGQMDNVNRYWIKWFLRYSSGKEKWEQLLDELLVNVTEAPSKEKLVTLMCKTISDFDEFVEFSSAFVLYYSEGRYKELLDTCEYDLISEGVAEVQATCYKELGRFQEAISLLKKYPQNNIYCSSKTQLACNYILVGLEDEASKIIEAIDFDGDDITGLSFSEIGRAYFDVGSYDKCRTFFKQLCAVELEYSCFSFFDSVCKMLILNDVEEMENLKEFLMALLDGEYETNTDHMKFRTRMLFCCCFIREEEYEKANSYAKEILEEQKENPFHKKCFRELLFFSKYMKLRNEYKQAMVTLEIVEFLRTGLHIVEKPTLNGVEIDIQRDIEFCAKRLGCDSRQRKKKCILV